MKSIALFLSLIFSIPGFAASLSEGCKNPSVDQSYRQSSAGKSVIVSTPKYEAFKAHPLVVSFHGYGMNAQWMRDLTGGVEGYFPEAIYAYVDAGKAAWDGGDYYVFDGVVFDLGKKYCLDLDQVFAVGFSNGAFFVNGLAIHRADRIKAIVASAGGGGGSVPVGALVMHGKADQFVSFGYGAQSARDWAAANGCDAPYTPNENGCMWLNNCKKRQVVWCPWDGPHHWPEWIHKDVADFFRHFGS